MAGGRNLLCCGSHWSGHWAGKKLILISNTVFFRVSFLPWIQAGLAYIVKRYKRQSYVTMLLGITIAASGLAMLAINIWSFVEGTASMSFSSFCGASIA